MDNIEQRDYIAGLITSQFDMFANYANGIYWRAVMRSENDSTSKVSALSIAMHIREGADTFVSASRTIMDAHAHQSAAGNAEIYTALQQHISDTCLNLNAIAASVGSQIVKAWSERLVRDTFGITNMQTVDLKHMDKIGRVRSARYAVDTAARHYAVNAHVTERVIALKDNGFTTARLEYPNNTDHDNHGVVVDLSTQAVWRAQYFHPNTSATVVPNA